MYIKQITLTSIKSFKDVTFDFTRPDGSFAGWTVFVGGNGSGKTTVLRAIALALMGPRAGASFLGRNQGWIAKGADIGSSNALIQLHDEFDAFRDSIEITRNGEFWAGVRWKLTDPPEFPREYTEFDATRESRHAQTGPWHPAASGWFAIGYGPMRRLTGSSENARILAESNERAIQFVTLFEEGAALSEGERWLRLMYARTLEERPDRAEIDAVLQGALSLLNDGLLPEGIRVCRTTVDRIFVNDAQGVEMPLHDISDGCRSIIATVLDIVLRLYETYGEKLRFLTGDSGMVYLDLPGVIIIDEAEAHLHPEWQRDLPEWFKKHFPNIQFIVSTHSPLIAQAADENGLFILPAQGDFESEPRPATPEELERIRLGTAFQTLMESAFGLYTTRSPWATEQIEHWQKLNAMEKAGVELTPNERHDHTELRRQMGVAFREPSTPVNE